MPVLWAAALQILIAGPLRNIRLETEDLSPGAVSVAYEFAARTSAASQGWGDAQDDEIEVLERMKKDNEVLGGTAGWCLKFLFEGHDSLHDVARRRSAFLQFAHEAKQGPLHGVVFVGNNEWRWDASLTPEDEGLRTFAEAYGESFALAHGDTLGSILDQYLAALRLCVCERARSRVHACVRALVYNCASKLANVLPLPYPSSPAPPAPNGTRDMYVCLGVGIRLHECTWLTCDACGVLVVLRGAGFSGFSSDTWRPAPAMNGGIAGGKGEKPGRSPVKISPSKDSSRRGDGGQVDPRCSGGKMKGDACSGSDDPLPIFQPLPMPNFGQLPPLPPLIGGALRAGAADDPASCTGVVGQEAQGRGVVVASAEDRAGGVPAMEKLKLSVASLESQFASGDAAVVEREKVEPRLPLSEW